MENFCRFLGGLLSRQLTNLGLILYGLDLSRAGLMLLRNLGSLVKFCSFTLPGLLLCQNFHLEEDLRRSCHRDVHRRRIELNFLLVRIFYRAWKAFSLDRTNLVFEEYT